MAVVVFLIVLVAQFAFLSYALQRDHALMRAIVEENEASRKAVDALSNDLFARVVALQGVGKQPVSAVSRHNTICLIPRSRLSVALVFLPRSFAPPGAI